MPRALVIGDVIDDILVRPLATIRPDTDTPAEISKHPGGSGANFASWLAQTHKLTPATQLAPIGVTFIGRVAEADLERHSSSLVSFRVMPALQGDTDAATGAIVVLAEPSSRSFLTSRGANQNLDLDLVTESVLFGFDLVYVSAYSIFGIRNPESFADLVKRASRVGCKVAVDPGSASFISDFGVPKLLDLLRGVDVLLPNLDEGRLLSGEFRPDLVASHLAERFSELVLTMGVDGALLSLNGEAPTPVAAFSAEALDPTGAGDAFAAGYLAARLCGRDPVQAAEVGARLGAIAVTLVGGRPRI